MTSYYKEYKKADKAELEDNVVLASLDGVDYYEDLEGEIKSLGASADSFFATFCDPIPQEEARELRPNLVAAMEAKGEGMPKYYKDYIDQAHKIPEPHVVLAFLDGKEYYLLPHGRLYDGPTDDSYLGAYCVEITAEQAREIRPNLVAKMEELCSTLETK